MIAYAPPAPILIFVVIDYMESAVDSVIVNERIIIIHAPISPAFPTTHPSLKYIITPSIVSKVGVKTPPKVPNFFICCKSDILDNAFL